MLNREEMEQQLLEQIQEMLHRKQYAQLRTQFQTMEPADIAQVLEDSGEEQMPVLYRLLPKELAAEVFVELESDSQEMLINGFSNTELKEVLDELYVDDAADIVEEMPATVVIRILDKATPEMRKSINEILKYPEDSAGSIMNVEYLSLKRHMTVAEAFKRIRRAETIKSKSQGIAASAASWRPSTPSMSPTPPATCWVFCPSGICCWRRRTTPSRSSWIRMWCP